MEDERIPILLIEDSPTDALLYREALEGAVPASFQVTIAERLDLGLEQFNTHHFEAVLLDLGLPDSQGLDTFHAVYKKHPDIPIIVLSGLVDEQRALEAVQAGAQDYLEKGKVGQESIIRVVRYAIQRQRLNSALQESENRFRTLFEHAPVAYLSLDAEGYIIDFNIQLLGLLGYEPQELYGRNFGEFWSSETRSTFPRIYSRFIRDGKINADLQLLKKDGAVLEIALEGEIQSDSDGQFARTHFILHDITERKLAEQAIRESQERFGTVFRSSPVSIFIATADGTIVDINNAFLEMFGYTRAQVIGRSSHELNLWHDPRDQDKIVRILGSQGAISNRELKYRMKNGEVGESLAFVELIELAGKQCLLIMLHDITERVRAEGLLKKSEAELKKAQQISHVGNWVWYISTNRLEWSDEMYRIFGIDKEGFSGDLTDVLQKAIHPDDRPAVEQSNLSVIKDKKPIPLEYRVVRPDGAVRTVWAEAGELTLDPAGNPAILTGIVQDITERKLTEDALRESEERFRRVFEESPLGMVMVHPADNKFLRANASFCEMLGYTQDEFQRMTFMDVTDPEHRDRDVKAVEQLWEGKLPYYKTEKRYLKKNGETFWGALQALVIRSQDGKPLYSLATIEDITERKRAEENQRQRADELAALQAIVLEITTPQNLPDLLQSIVERAAHLLDADGGGLYLCDPERQELRAEVSFNTPENYTGTVLKYGEGAAGTVAQSGQALLIDDYHTWQGRAAPFADEQSLKAICSAPMLWNDQVTGVIHVLRSSEEKPFTQHELELLTLLANHAAIAVENARLLEELKSKLAERKQAELALRESEEKYRRLVENIPNVVWTTDNDGVTTYISPVIDRIYGYTQDEIYNNPDLWFGRIHPDDVVKVKEAFESALRGESTFNIEYRIQRKDGDWIWLHDKAILIQEKGGEKFVQGIFEDITEWVQAERLRLAAEEKYRFIFDNAIEGLYQSTPEGRFITVNPALAHMWSYESPEDMLSSITNIARQVYVDARQRDEFARLMQEKGEVRGFEFQARRKDGGLIWVLEDARAVKDASGKLLYYEGYIQDNTARKEAEEKLKESEEKFSKAFYAHATAMQIIDLDSEKRADLNKNFLDITGYTREELTQSDVYALNLWKDPKAQKDALKKLVKEGMISAYPMEAVTKSGETKLILLNAALLDLGSRNWAIESWIDITEQKQAENKLRESEERYRLLFENMPIGIYRTTPGGQILEANPAFAQMLGYPKVEELLAVNVLDIFENPDERELELSQLEDKEDIHHSELQLHQKDGNVIWVRDVFRVVRDRDGQILYFEGSLEDITERVRAEKKLKENEERFKSIFENATVGIYRTSPDGEILLANPTLIHMLGYDSFDELAQRDLEKEGYDPEYPRTQFRELLEEQGEVRGFEAVWKRKDGSVIYIRESARAIRDNAGQVLYYEGTVEDVTERVQAEEAEHDQRILAEALRETAETLNRSLDYGSVLERILSIAGRVVPNDTATVILIEDGKLHIAGSHGYKERGLSPEKTLSALNFQEPGNLKQIFESREPVVIPDVSAYPHWKTLPGTEWLRSSVGAPLMVQDSVIGFLLLDSETPGFFTPLHAERLQAFANQAALAIENARLFEETQQLAAFNQNIIQSMAEGIVMENDDGIFYFANPEALKMLGYTSEELSGMHWTEVIPADQHAIVQAADERRKRGETDRYEVEFVRKDGQRISVMVSGSPQFEAAGNFTGSMAVFTDISERVQTEKLLRDSEQRYRTLINQIPDIVYIDDISSGSSRTQFVSPYIEQMLGFTPEEWITGGYELWKGCLHPEDRKRVLADYEEAIQDEKMFNCEYRLSNKDGQILWVRDRATLLRDEENKPSSFHGVIHDITARMQANEAIRESEQQFRLLFSASPDAILLIDPHDPKVNWPIVDCNEAACQMNGYTREELVGQSINILNTTAGTRKERDAYLKRLQSGGIVHLESKHRHKDGHVFPVEVSTSRFAYGGRELVLGIDRDITARVQAEAEIELRVSELETLYENGLVISGLMDSRLIAQRIVEVLEKKLSWHHVAIRQYHPESDHLELLALKQPGLSKAQTKKQVERLNESIRTPDQGLSGWVVRHGKPVRCNRNLFEDPRYVDTYPGLNSGLYVPIQIGDRIIGSIAVESEKEDAFTEQDERLLLTLANQSAIALDNARLYQQLQQELSERSRAEGQVRKLNSELEQRVALRTAEIEAAHHRMELAASAAGFGVWELNSGSTKVYWDEHMHSLYGTSPGEFQPTLSNWVDFVYPEDRQMVEEKRAQAIEQGTLYENEFRVVTADGSIRHISSRAAVLLDDDQKFGDMIGVDMDITTVKQAEETLLMANAELERALRVKDEFLANMSHELRTPLNAILGLSESLEEQIAGPLNEKQAKYLHTISESGHHLLELINDILDLAKIEAGQIVLDMNKVNVRLLCQASTRMVIQLAQKKELEQTIEIDEAIDLIWADERRLKQMIVNLLSNAVKFTPQGGKFGIKVEAKSSNNTVLITVWDSGIGISDQDLERLFKPFVQLDSSLARESTGTGLGLALVAQMARLHGGHIRVDSTLGKGSRFTIVLPWKQAKQTGSLTLRQTGGQANQLNPTARKKSTILLVEDTEAVVMMLKDYLESNGYQVAVAGDGLDGIDQARRLRPDLILMDVMMPGMDGLEATRRIRSEPATADIPIIGLTALAMSSDRERCLAAGMNDYLSKPVKLNELVSTIRSFLSPGEE